MSNPKTTWPVEKPARAVTTGSIDLERGCFDVDGFDAIERGVTWSIEDGHNQYPTDKGIGEWCSAIAQFQQYYRGLDFDPDSDIVIHRRVAGYEAPIGH
jgi:aspartate/methionine/tyrosine aminotransferase